MRWRSSVTDVLTRLEGFLHGACLRHRLWSQIDHANALRCELGEYGGWAVRGIDIKPMSHN
jgi:hypothetical protein